MTDTHVAVQPQTCGDSNMSLQQGHKTSACTQVQYDNTVVALCGNPDGLKLLYVGQMMMTA